MPMSNIGINSFLYENYASEAKKDGIENVRNKISYHKHFVLTKQKPKQQVKSCKSFEW